MITSDFHMHTGFSADAEVTAREMIEAAIKRGLDMICITDHYDEDMPHINEKYAKVSFIYDPEEYFKVLKPLQEEYADKIDVRIGTEIGLQPHLGGFYHVFVNKYPFDFVIGSVHVVRRKSLALSGFFEGRSDEEGLAEAFEDTLKNIKAIDDFDVLGHIDCPVRYAKNKGEKYSYHLFSDVLDSILSAVIEKGKGIEINMAGIKYGLGFCHPHPDVLKRYRELGGEMITVGSDAHRPEHVGYCFEKAADILEECGFRYYTVFSGRKPYFRRIGQLTDL